MGYSFLMQQAPGASSPPTGAWSFVPCGRRRLGPSLLHEGPAYFYTAGAGGGASPSPKRGLESRPSLERQPSALPRPQEGHGVPFHAGGGAGPSLCHVGFGVPSLAGVGTGSTPFARRELCSCPSLELALGPLSLPGGTWGPVSSCSSRQVLTLHQKGSGVPSPV